MSAPWEILGLSPACTQQELREAYARLLKQHRPDRDPEGFRRVRDAYEFMRRMARDDAPAAGIRLPLRPPLEAPVDPEQAPPTDSSKKPESDEELEPPEKLNDRAPFPRPPGGRMPVTVSADAMGADPVAQPVAVRPRRTLLERLTRKLQKARSSGNAELEQRLLRKLLKFWRAKQTADDGWDRLLAEQLTHHPDAILPLMEPADAVTDVARNSTGIAYELMRARARRGEFHPELLGVLAALEMRLRENPAPAAAASIIAGAQSIALVYWKRAQDLANAVYPHLSEFERRMEFGDLDRLIQAGKEVGSLAVKDRATLARCLANRAADPEEKDVKLAFRNVSMIGNAATAKTLLAESFPIFAPRLRVQRNAAGRRAPASRYTSSRSGSTNYWYVFVLLGLLVRFLVHSSTLDTPPPQPSNMPRYAPFTLTDEQQRAIDEIRKRNEKRKHGVPEKPPDDSNNSNDEVLRKLYAIENQDSKKNGAGKPDATPSPLPQPLGPEPQPGESQGQ